MSLPVGCRILQTTCKCKTHKESVEAVKTSSRSAGFLAAVTESGIICGLGKIITAETLSQRYCFLADVANVTPGLQNIVHDDACHLRVFARARRDDGPLASRLAEMRYIVDRPHSLNHVDPECQAICFPTVPANMEALATSPTPINESVNAQLSPLKHIVHHMQKWVCFFIVSECADEHNIMNGIERRAAAARAEKRVKRARVNGARPPVG